MIGQSSVSLQTLHVQNYNSVDSSYSDMQNEYPDYYSVLSRRLRLFTALFSLVFLFDR